MLVETEESAFEQISVDLAAQLVTLPVRRQLLVARDGLRRRRVAIDLLVDSGDELHGQGGQRRNRISLGLAVDRRGPRLPDRRQVGPVIDPEADGGDRALFALGDRVDQDTAQFAGAHHEVIGPFEAAAAVEIAVQDLTERDGGL